MKIDAMNLEIDSYVENANIVKDAVLNRLLKDKILTEEQSTEYKTKWQIIIFKNNWFKNWFKVFGKNTSQNDWSFKFIRLED